MPEHSSMDEQQENARFLEMPDEDVVVLAQNGDGQALAYLLNKYKNFVRSKARSYFLIGADHEDIVQEGMIGLYKSIRDFQPARLASFRSFAELCVKRQIITAIKAATRQKHVPLNSYVSLNKPLYDEESDRTLLDVIEGRVTNPEDLFISQEDLSRIQSQISEILSDLERGATALSATGMYSGESRTVLISVVSQREVLQLKRIVREADRKAFVFITDTHETLGEGFSNLQGD